MRRHEPVRWPETSASYKDHAGEETGFGHAQQEAHGVETSWAADEDHQAGDHAPSDHQGGNPAADTKLLKYQIARNLKEEIANEEDARGSADHALAQSQLSAHLQDREAHVDAVEIGDDIEEEQERHEPPHEPGDDGGF